MSWREFEEGRLGMSLGNLSDGESVEVFIDSEPYLNEEEIEQPDGSVETSESLRVPCAPISVPDGYTDMNEEEIETTDDPYETPENPEYDIINSSTSFKKAMREAFPDGVNPVEATVTITAHQPDETDTFGRKYSVEA